MQKNVLVVEMELSQEERRKLILSAYLKNPKVSKTKLAKDLEIPRRTVSRVLKNASEFQRQVPKKFRTVLLDKFAKKR